MESPTNVTASAVTDTTLTLNWDEVSYHWGISKYEVFRDGVSIGEVTETRYEDTGLSPSTEYTYQVKAVSTNGIESKLSSGLTVTTSAGV
nr:fibronectin type III domain-containing protein [Pseudalkalibacillus caeni]